MTTIDHEKAALIASGYGTTYTTPSDAAVRLVFAAYLDAMRRLRSLHEENVSITRSGVIICDQCFGSDGHAENCKLHGLKFEDTP